MSTKRLRRAGQAIAIYGLTGALSLVVVVLAYRLWNADLSVPLYYKAGGDIHFHLGLFKTVVETGWYTTNPRLGAPGVMDLHDFPYVETSTFLTIRALSLFLSDPFLIANLSFLGGFVAASLTSLFVFRRFAVSGPAAVAGSLLFAFAPYHFWRGTWHPHLAGYYPIPLVLLVAIWLSQGRPLFFGRAGPRWSRSRTLPTLVACGLISIAGPYYAFFGASMLLAAGLIGLIRKRRRAGLFDTALVLLLVVGSFVAQLAPFLAFGAKHGTNPAVGQRPVEDLSLLALRIHDLIRPTTGHRLRFLWGGPQGGGTEAQYAGPLGAPGTCGFLLLIAVGVAGPTWMLRRLPLLAPLARLVLAALLFAIVGGFNETFAINITTRIRCYNRMGIFIEFLSVFAMTLVLDQYRRRLIARGKGWVFGLLLGAVIILGLLDQIPDVMVPNYPLERASFEGDARFVTRIEESLPPESLVFQLPQCYFPEFLKIHEMEDYAHFRGYLHSKRLRWSYGAAPGRTTERWQRDIASQPVPIFIDRLRAAGFAGLWINRTGLRNGSNTAFINQVASALGQAPMVSRDGQLYFFTLRTP